MAKTKTENEKPVLIVIKRVKKVAGGHHGGAWKVAYADFVTAMMAFFLLLWLLNVTTDEQKNAISNYFDPSHPKISDVVSGAGGLLGGLAMTPDGAMVSTVQPIVQPDAPDTTTRGALKPDGESEPDKLSEQRMEEELRKKEDERFKVAADSLKAAIANSPDLKDLANNLLIDITPEGLRIQIVDDKGRSMFPSGSSVMFDFMRQLLLKVTSAVKPLPNQVSVRGHTDSVKYKDPKAYDNWNLSSDRAQASRRVMVEGGLPEKRIENVMGRADREHLLPNEPANPRNRRITIILLRDRVKAPPRPLPGKAETPAAAADKKEVQQPAEKSKLPGIQIIDDTKPGSPDISTGAPTTTPGTSTRSGTSAPAAEDDGFRDGSRALPVAPDAGGSSQPKVITFGTPAPQSDSLYSGPTQSPFTVPAQNKPPTIKTPVFKTEEIKEPAAPVLNPAAPVLPQSTMTFGDTTAAPAPAVEDLPDLELIQPEAQPKVITFGDSVPEEAPQETEPAPSSSGDGKVLTFD